ncbi:MAG: tyrosine-type recombinase/integrase [Actinobacteria bacterium]|nr:tyrosine-type recombinase/integrase [Actinomycetota bacterium]MBU1608926.1 tyrosine-type recombinase/integrase [Actinomycetota bacterium]MBU2316367.1 tyrosine-type recombinase/integrase [Actinomycetota bacterium]MBU2384057.1 tyrosine-type recombinase/integrase [Actinomycetota bacterium]
MVWLRTLPQGHTANAHRVSVRGFYRWAAAAGRVFEDPSLPQTFVTRRKPVPSSWQATLDEFRTYLRSIGRNETTVRTRLSQLSRFARDHSAVGPWDITFDDIVQWLGAKRWAPEMRRAHRGVLRVFYGWAHESGRTTHNPAAKLPVVKRGIHFARPVIDHDYQLALVKADDREHLALRLAAELGLRAGECALVHSRDIIVRDGQPSLLVHGKGDKPRVVPLTDSMHGALRARPEGYLFPGQVNGHISPNYMSKLISRILPPGVTMHALRHRFATRAYAVDRDVFAVQQLLGHASPQTTQQYVQVADLELRRLVNAVGA